MDNIKTRYGIRLFVLDRDIRGLSYFVWDKDFDFEEIIKKEERKYGLKLISTDKEVSVIMKYSNIIWDYNVYFASYKKRYQPLLENDERWETIEKALEFDLKTMGLELLKKDILTSLKKKEYFEYHNKSLKQFKNYYIPVKNEE